MRRIGVLVISVFLLCGFVGVAVRSISQQKASVRKDLTRDHKTVGEMIGLAAKRMDPQRLKSFVEKLNQRKNRWSFRWIEANAAPAQLRSEEMYTRIRKKDNPAQQITTWHRIRTENTVLGILQITETNHPSTKRMAGTIFRSSLLVILSIVGILLAFFLGWSFARRPDQKMVTKAKRALAGDFSGRIAPSQSGTLADVAAAMDIMSEKIESTEAGFRAEVASKLVIMEQLRHADRLKTVGQLTSGILHELGTPLTIISGRAKMIEERDVEGEEAIENAKIVVEQTERISAMIRNVLNFARKGKNTNSAVDLNEVISKAILLLRPVALKQGVSLKWEAATKPMVVNAEVSQLQQVLANLILNAIQASHSSSEVVVALRSDRVTPSRLETHLKTEDCPDCPDSQDFQDLNSVQEMDCVILSVQDFGEGIAKQNIDAIFDSFFTTKEAGTGTGLGLAISKQIAIEHNGWIEVESVLGGGSTFTVFLPRKGTCQ